MGMGYQGYAKFYTDANGGNDPSTAQTVVVLATGASVNLVLEPIYSTGVWGAGWYNAAESTHYADNALRYEGNIDTELQVGTLGAYWNLIQDFAIAHRAYPKSLEISPDGAHVYKYLIKDEEGSVINSPTSYFRDDKGYSKGAYCTSINFSTSAGSVVSSSVGIVSLYRTEADPAGGAGEQARYEDFSYINQARGVVAGDVEAIAKLAPLNPGATNVNPIPYWRTNARLYCTRNATDHAPGPTGISELFNIGGVSDDFTPQAGVETVEWNIDVGNNQQILYTCSGKRLPRAVLMGPMSVTGAVTLFNDQGVFDPVTGPNGEYTDYDTKGQYMTAEHTWFNVEITADNNRKVYINVPAAVIESDEYSIQSADSVTNRAFNIKGLGGRCIVNNAKLGSFSLPPCVMSRYTTSADPDDLLVVPWTYSNSSYVYDSSAYAGYEPAEESSSD